MLGDAQSARGIETRQDLAKAVADFHNIGSESDKVTARHEIIAAADRMNARDVLPRSLQLQAAAHDKRAEAERIANGAGVGESAAARLNPQNLARAHRNTDSSLRRYTEASGQAQSLEFGAAQAAAREERASRIPFTKSELSTARLVHDGSGWHEVVRVNGKTVTVKTPYSWTDTIAHGKIEAIAVTHPTDPKKVVVHKVRHG